MKSRSRQSRSPRGQAMVEYSVINFALIVALLFSTTVRLLPGPGGPRNLIQMMMLAFQNYLDAYFYILSLPFP